MAIDTSIYNALLQRPKSVAEYDAEAMQGQQNQLALTMGRQKMDEYSRGLAADANERQITSGFGSDKAANYNALVRGGLLPKAQAYAKQNAELDEVQSKVDKQKAELADARRKQSRDYLDSVRTPEQYIAWHEANHKDPILGPELAARGITAEQARASIMEALSKPGGFEEMLKKSALGLDKYIEMNKPTTITQNLGGTSQISSIPGLGGAPTVLSNTPITQDANSIASNAQSDKNSRRTEASAAAGRAQSASQHRETLAQGGKPPSGYRWTKGGDLEAIPGGPGGKTATATEGERKAATLLKRLDFSEKQLSDALKEDEGAAKPGLIANGLRSMGAEALANTVATGSARQRVESAQLDMLDAALTLGTGAAYTREQLEGYRKSYFPQIGDDDKAIKDKQGRVKNVIDAAKIAAGRAATPANPDKPNAGGPIKITGAADYAKVPSGAEYMAPDGHVRRKP